jgi:hypothetical protein
MASTLLVAAVLSRVSILLQDTVPQYQRWPEAELVNWLNDAQVAIAKYLPDECTVSGALKLANGTRQMIETVATADFKLPSGAAPAVAINGNRFVAPLRNMGADGLTPGRAIRLVDRDDLDSQDPDWHTRTGTAVASVMYDEMTPRVFWISPAAPGKWVDIVFLAQPTKIPAGGVPGTPVYPADGSGAGAATTISISDQNLDELVDYVVARANMKDTTYADSGKAAIHSQRFLGSINARVMVATGVNPNLRLLPGVIPEAKRGP